MIRAPSYFGHWGVTGATTAQVLALLAPFAVTLMQNGPAQGMILAAALAIVIFWEGLFGLLRHQMISMHGLTTALIVSVLVPPDLPLWQLGIALSLGVILGELIFGGRGFGFLNPATVSLSLLLFSFPQASLMEPTPALAIATLLGAALLLYLGLISWRVILGAGLAVVTLLAVQQQAVDAQGLATALAFGLVFLICDPNAAASTNPGRWAYGILTGALIILFSVGQLPLPTDAVVFAALLASVFAPLIDHLVILADAARRRSRLD